MSLDLEPIRKALLDASPGEWRLAPPPPELPLEGEGLAVGRLVSSTGKQIIWPYVGDFYQVASRADWVLIEMAKEFISALIAEVEDTQLQLDAQNKWMVSQIDEVASESELVESKDEKIAKLEKALMECYPLLRRSMSPAGVLSPEEIAARNAREALGEKSVIRKGKR